MAQQQEIEIDTREAQQALLHIRTSDGQEWVAAALLGSMTPVGGGEERAIEPGEDIRLVSLTVVY